MREDELLVQIQKIKDNPTRLERLFVRVGLYDHESDLDSESMKHVSSIEYGDGSHYGDKDELVQHLFDLSLHCEIYKLQQMCWATDPFGKVCLYGLEVRVRECSGSTNITPDVIESVADVLSPRKPPQTITWAWKYT